MNWYYVDGGQQAGPVDDGQLAGLVRDGKVQPDTLVWREGLADWQPYQEAKLPGLRLASNAAAPAATAAPMGTEAACAECGRIFNTDDMIRHGELYVCANCKPVFMQKLAEGAKLGATALNYASFGIRFAAYLLDGLILFVVNFGIGMVAGLSAGQAVGTEPRGALALQLILFFIQLAIGISYEVVLIGKYGATLGKMACKIMVVTPEGGRVSYMRALGRYFAKILSGMICAIGFIMAGFDEERRALHDRICGTRVVTR